MTRPCRTGVAVGTAMGSMPQHEFDRSRRLKRKKPKSELTADPILTVIGAILVGTLLSTPVFGWTPMLVVSGGLLATGWILGMLGGEKRR
jgi:hypothetical protein